MKQRTAVAVGVAAVGFLGSGLVAYAAVTGEGLLGFGNPARPAVAEATTSTSAHRPKVVTKYESVEQRVVVTTAAPAAVDNSTATATDSGSAGATGSWASAAQGGSGSSSPTTPAAPVTDPSTEPTTTPTTQRETTTTIRAGSHDRPPSTTTTEPHETTTTTVPETTTTTVATTDATITKTFGSVDVQYSASSLTIVAVHPADGFHVEVSGHGLYYEIQFQSHAKEYQLRVYVSGGQLHSQVGD